MPSFSYSSRDFDTIKADLLARADRVFPEWTDRDPSDFGMLLLDLWAYAADTMHYYIDRAAGEYFLPTATQRESVLALANLFDYIPTGKVSAVSSLTLENVSATDYTVAPGTRFVGRDGNDTFQCYTPVGGTISAESFGNITVYEGAYTEGVLLTDSASGQSNQRYSIREEGVVGGSVAVDVYEDGVNPTSYQRVSRIATADVGDRVFALDITSIGETVIVFGNTLSGWIPPAGATIKVNYAVGSGSGGNFPADTIVGFRDEDPADVLISSNTAFSGGEDDETISSLKASIPSVISAQARAVTRQDFVSMATQVDGVAKASIAFVPGTGGAGASANGSVTVYAQAYRSDYLTTTDTSQAVSQDMQDEVVATIQPRALLGVDVFAADTITWNPIDVTATVYVNERFVSNWVKQACVEALAELFAFDNVFFGQRITLGQVYRILLGVEGVEYVTVTIFDDQAGGGLEDSILTSDIELPKMGTVVFNMSGGITTYS